ncbi:MAG: hypothetical protein K2L85_02000 [Paramuribaculum sp.]|nr:hypothetical protein [Paramuribaculum sp.]
MKTSIISSLFLFAAINASGQTAADTIADITDASRLIITENASNVTVSIANESEGDSLTEILSRNVDNTVIKQRYWNSPLRIINNNDRPKFDLCIGGPGIGWVNAVDQPDGLGLEMGKSLEISWLNMLSIKYDPWKWGTLSFGLGLDWRNYRISTSDHRMITTEDNGIGIDSYPEGATPHGSRLKVFSLGVPIMWTQRMPLRWLDGSYFHITVGAIFNYNAHGSLQTKWTEADGRDAVMKTNHIGQRLFTVDFIGMVKIGWGLNAYVRYSPQTVLRGKNRPQFKPFSTGMVFLF